MREGSVWSGVRRLKLSRERDKQPLTPAPETNILPRTPSFQDSKNIGHSTVHKNQPSFPTSVSVAVCHITAFENHSTL